MHVGTRLLDADSPLYDRIEIYFGSMNTADKGKTYEILVFNGRFFKPDELLDSVKISDEIHLKPTKKNKSL